MYRSIPHEITSQATHTQFIVHFYQAVQENNLAEITVSYESGWNRLTEKYYAKTEWPEAELIAPLVNDGTNLGLALVSRNLSRCFV